MSRFGRPAEKFSEARRSLMLPLGAVSEERRFAEAFHQCSSAIEQFDVSSVPDEYARDALQVVQSALDTTGISDPTGEGTHIHRIRSMDLVAKSNFADAVDTLATWFHDAFYSRAV